MIAMKKVWDSSIVKLNWLFVLCLAGILATAGVNGVLAYAHTFFASLLLIAVVLRLFYGFTGTQTARLSTMLSPASDVLMHLSDLMEFRPQSWVGHSPIGGLFAFLALIGLGLTALSGLLVVNGEGYASWLAVWAGADSVENSYSLHAVLTTMTVVLWSTYAIGVILNLMSNKDSLATYALSGKKSVILMQNLNDKDLTTSSFGYKWASFGLSTALALLMFVPLAYQMTATPNAGETVYTAEVELEANTLSKIETAAGQSVDVRPSRTQNPIDPQETIGNTNVRNLPASQEQNAVENTTGFSGMQIDIPVQTQ